MRKFHIVFAPSSRRDIKRIAHFIARDNLKRSLLFTDDIVAFIGNHLSLFPFSGRRQDDGTYKIVYRKTVLIYYKVTEETNRVDILHIKRSSKPLVYFE